MWTFFRRGENSDLGKRISILELRKLLSQETGEVVGSHIRGIKNDGNARLKIRIASNPLKETGLGVAQTLFDFFYFTPTNNDDICCFYRGISSRLNLSDTPSRVKYPLPSLRL